MQFGDTADRKSALQRDFVPPAPPAMVSRREVEAALCFALCLLPGLASAQVRVVSFGESPQSVFGGTTGELAVAFHNPAKRPVTTAMLARICQASSSTAAPLDAPRPWKTLEVLPGQTVLESISLSFPAVRAETRFILQWLDDQGRGLGRSEVLVYPANLLSALKPLAGGRPPGLCDPPAGLELLLNQCALEWEALEPGRFAAFAGRLAIIGAEANGPSPGRVREIAALAKSGVAVVWIQPAMVAGIAVEPLIHPVRVGAGAVTIVQSRAVANLATRPQSQLNLLRAAELAVKPGLLVPPDLKP